jgi:hypothetical protein
MQDASIAIAIRNGKNQMPAFNLPDDIVVGLVAKVRSLRSK